MKKKLSKNAIRGAERVERSLESSNRVRAYALPTAAVLAAMMMACGNSAESIQPDPSRAVRVHVAPVESAEEPSATPVPSITPAMSPEMELVPAVPTVPPKPAPSAVPPKVKAKPIAPSPKSLRMVGDMAAVKPTPIVVHHA